MSAHTEHAQSPTVVKVVKMVGVSEESWEEAARMLVSRASHLEHCHVSGLHLLRSTAVVRDGKIVEYHVTANLTFVAKLADV